MRLVLIIFALSFSLGMQGKTKVALVFAKSEKSDQCKTKMCLHGSFKRGTAVVLLAKNRAETCTARVGRSFKMEYTPGPFEASELNGLKKCKLPPDEAWLAVFDRPKLKYKIFSLSEIDKQELESLDRKLKLSKVFKKAWTREPLYKGGEQSKGIYELSDFKAMPAAGFQVKLPGRQQLQVLSHQLGEKDNRGILFSFYKEEWSPLASSFTTAVEPKIFSINGKLMISTQVTCQQTCGYLDTEVYEFNGKVFKLIYNNADFST